MPYLYLLDIIASMEVLGEVWLTCTDRDGNSLDVKVDASSCRDELDAEILARRFIEENCRVNSFNTDDFKVVKIEKIC